MATGALNATEQMLRSKLFTYAADCLTWVRRARCFLVEIGVVVADELRPIGKECATSPSHSDGCVDWPIVAEVAVRSGTRDSA